MSLRRERDLSFLILLFTLNCSRHKRDEVMTPTSVMFLTDISDFSLIPTTFGVFFALEDTGVTYRS